MLTPRETHSTRSWAASGITTCNPVPVGASLPTPMAATGWWPRVFSWKTQNHPAPRTRNIHFSRLNVFIISLIWHIWGQYCPSGQSHISTDLSSWLGATQDVTMRRELRMLWDVMGWGCAGQAVLLKCRVDWSDQLEVAWLPYDDGEEKLALGEDDTWHWLDSHEQ